MTCLIINNAQDNRPLTKNNQFSGKLKFEQIDSSKFIIYCILKKNFLTSVTELLKLLAVTPGLFIVTLKLSLVNNELKFIICRRLLKLKGD